MNQTVGQFYEGLGRCGDWDCREKIEKAVFAFKISWKQEVDDSVCQIIAEQS